MLRINFNRAGNFPTVQAQGSCFHVQDIDPRASERITPQLLQRPRFTHGVAGMSFGDYFRGSPDVLTDLASKYPNLSTVALIAGAGLIVYGLFRLLAPPYEDKNSPDDLKAAIDELASDTSGKATIHTDSDELQLSLISNNPADVDAALRRSNSVIKAAMGTSLDMFHALEACVYERSNSKSVLGLIQEDRPKLKEARDRLGDLFDEIELLPLERHQAVLIRRQRRTIRRVKRVGDHVEKVAELYDGGIPIFLSADARQYLEKLFTKTKQLYIDVCQGYLYNNHLIWHDVSNDYHKLRERTAILTKRPLSMEQHVRNLLVGDGDDTMDVDSLSLNISTAQDFFTNSVGRFRRILVSIRKIAQAMNGHYGARPDNFKI